MKKHAPLIIVAAIAIAAYILFPNLAKKFVNLSWEVIKEIVFFLGWIALAIILFILYQMKPRRHG